MILQVEKTTIFEWYDGIVSGIISASGMQWICILLALKGDARRYLLVKCRREGASDLCDAITHGGFSSVAQILLNRLLSEADDFFILASVPCESAGINLEITTKLEELDLAAIALPCIDSAVSEEAVRRWLL